MKGFLAGVALTAVLLALHRMPAGAETVCGTSNTDLSCDNGPAGMPTDWTNGTNVCPVGGSITIPSRPRKWLYTQNRDLGGVTVNLPAIKGSDKTASTITIRLDPAPTSGGQGGVDERSLGATYVPQGVITVNCTAGQYIAVGEG